MMNWDPNAPAIGGGKRRSLRGRREKPTSLLAKVACLLAFGLLLGANAASAKPPTPAGPKQETQQAFDRYIRLTEARVATELTADGPFLSIDLLPAAERDAAYDALRHGELRIDRGITLDNGQRIACPGGMIHHWIGIVFIPGVTVDQTLSAIEDYDHDAVVFAPQVERAKTISHSGDDFKIYMRLRWKQVITVVLDTDHDVHYQRLSPARAASRSISTRVQEVADAGTSSERDIPEDKASGYLWRTDGYWKFLERDGGTYVQCEIVSLTRDVPVGLGWLIDPFVQNIPRQSLRFTLEATRNHFASAHTTAAGQPRIHSCTYSEVWIRSRVHSFRG
jgi:hypothetical protein